VLQAGAAQIQREWDAWQKAQNTGQNATKCDPRERDESGEGEGEGVDVAVPAAEWIEWLVRAAPAVLALYGATGAYLDFDRLQAEAAREQTLLAALESLRHTVLQEVRQLYRQIHPSRHLQTLQGVGEEGAAVFASFIGDVARFDSASALRGWSGMVPCSKQSSRSEAKGLHITQAGPDLVRKFVFLDANVARQRDPQLAEIYYRQVVEYGKHHNQAVCTVATHLLDRIHCVLVEDRPYELRDVDGTPVTPAQALAIIAERYTVPPEVRRRNNKRARQERRDRHAEKQLQRAERAAAPGDDPTKTKRTKRGKAAQSR
jgi:hypothetical protein